MQGRKIAKRSRGESENRRPSNVGLRSSAIACSYCLQFGHVIVREPLWSLPAWTSVQVVRDLFEQVGFIIARLEVWESGGKWFMHIRNVNHFMTYESYFPW